jgi:hypothetical protein
MQWSTGAASIFAGSPKSSMVVRLSGSISVRFGTANHVANAHSDNLSNRLTAFDTGNDVLEHRNHGGFVDRINKPWVDKKGGLKIRVNTDTASRSNIQ